MRTWSPTLLAVVVLLSVMPARAAEPVKIGMITTLSGPGGYLGEDVRDGFLLAIDQEQGKCRISSACGLPTLFRRP